MSLQPEKKNRFSKLLGKRDKSPGEPITRAPDSAYASSDAPSAEVAKVSNSDLVPAEKDSDIANIDRDRNLAVKPSTGEVLDQDTGEVITVVTTTTTTTTTTTRRPGRRSPDVHENVTRDVQETTTDSNSQPRLAEMPANNSSTNTKQLPPSHSPAPLPPPPTSVPDRSTSKLTPPPSIPHKSLARKSGEYGTSAQAGPVDENYGPEPAAGRPNFSYPSRNRDSFDPDGSSLVTTNEPQRHNKSTRSDLMAAAKGLHVSPSSQQTPKTSLTNSRA
jgi:hypothetical protein